MMNSISLPKRISYSILFQNSSFRSGSGPIWDSNATNMRNQRESKPFQHQKRSKGKNFQDSWNKNHPHFEKSQPRQDHGKPSTFPNINETSKKHPPRNLLRSLTDAKTQYSDHAIPMPDIGENKYSKIPKFMDDSLGDPGLTKPVSRGNRARKSIQDHGFIDPFSEFTNRPEYNRNSRSKKIDLERIGALDGISLEEFQQEDSNTDYDVADLDSRIPLSRKRPEVDTKNLFKQETLPRGENRPLEESFSPELMSQIFEQHLKDTQIYTPARLSTMFGIKDYLIIKILNRKTWKISQESKARKIDAVEQNVAWVNSPGKYSINEKIPFLVEGTSFDLGKPIHNRTGSGSGTPTLNEKDKKMDKSTVKRVEVRSNSKNNVNKQADSTSPIREDQLRQLERNQKSKTTFPISTSSSKLQPTVEAEDITWSFDNDNDLLLESADDLDISQDFESDYSENDETLEGKVV